MRKFILKTILIVFLALLPNFFIGLLRIYKGDKTIPFERHNTDIFKRDKIRVPYVPEYRDRVMDLTGDTLKHIKVSMDKRGLSNVIPNPAPDIVFVGDSYFADMNYSCDSGMQAVCNRLLGYNASYNVGSLNGSSFNVYKYLTSHGLIAKPKIIIVEVGEHHFYSWLDLKKSLLIGEETQKSKKYFSLDLIFGNNIKHLTTSKIFKQRFKNGYRRIVQGRPIYFLNNKIVFISHKKVDSIENGLKFVQDYFKEKNTTVWFVIVPDKESLYPGIFGRSSILANIGKFRAAGLNMIDIYTELCKSPRYYYFDEDLHWNEKGVKKLMEVLLQQGALDTARRSL